MALSVPRRAIACLAAVGLTTVAGSAAPANESRAPTLPQLIGQKLVVRMDGTSPSASLLARVRLGQVGGVIVHRWNFDSPADLRAITRRLQRAAASGRQPPLLIGVDQEGGQVKTVRWIPPDTLPSAAGSAGLGWDRAQAGRGHRRCPARARDQHRLRPGRGRARFDSVVPLSAGPNLVVPRPQDRAALGLVRHRARPRRRARVDEAFSRDRAGSA